MVRIMITSLATGITIGLATVAVALRCLCWVGKGRVRRRHCHHTEISLWVVDNDPYTVVRHRPDHQERFPENSRHPSLVGEYIAMVVRAVDTKRRHGCNPP